MEKSNIAKATRTLIRLKHSLRADEEINAILPDRLTEFDNALQAGELKQLKAGLLDALGESNASDDEA
jgi:hypothetical protein